jgi:hypothetical protein
MKIIVIGTSIFEFEGFLSTILKEDSYEEIYQTKNKIIKAIHKKDKCEIYYFNKERNEGIINIQYFHFKEKSYEKIRYIYFSNNAFTIFEKIKEIPKIPEREKRFIEEKENQFIRKLEEKLGKSLRDTKLSCLSLSYIEIRVLEEKRISNFLNDNFSPIDFIKNLLLKGGEK